MRVRLLEADRAGWKVMQAWSDGDAMGTMANLGLWYRFPGSRDVNVGSWCGCLNTFACKIDTIAS
eukprot:5048997-Prymnesium_polylepis.1